MTVLLGQTLIALAAVCVTLYLGLLSIKRGKQTDKAAEKSQHALDIATNIQTIYDAQQRFIDALQEEVDRQRESVVKCEATCNNCRKALRLAEDRAISAEAAFKMSEKTIERLDNRVRALEAEISKLQGA